MDSLGCNAAHYHTLYIHSLLEVFDRRCLPPDVSLDSRERSGQASKPKQIKWRTQVIQINGKHLIADFADIPFLRFGPVGAVVDEMLPRLSDPTRRKVLRRQSRRPHTPL